MNKNSTKNYIILKYHPNDYEIIIVSESKKVKINKNNAEIMRRVLNKFQPIQIDEDTYIYSDVYLILLAFKREKNKNKRVNRKKSSNLKLCFLLTVSLAAGGVFFYNQTNKNQTSTETTNETNNPEENNEKFEKIKISFDNEVSENNTSTENNSTTEEEEIKKQEVSNNETEQDDIVETTNDKLDAIEENENEEIKINQITTELNYYEEHPGDSRALENAKDYDEIFLKYEKRYGVDINLLRAVAAQESSGRHNVTNGYAVGIMGIENTRANDNITVYNFETNEYEKIIVDYDKATKDADYNVMVRVAELQETIYSVINSNLIPNNEVLAYSLQIDNMGATRMQNILKSGVHWMEGRKLETRGDPEYYENVLSRLDNGTVINIKLPDGTFFSTVITNLALEKNYSKN